MVWIMVTVVPNEDHLDLPRCKMLLDTDEIVAFSAPAGVPTQVWTTWDIDTPTLQVGESLEEIQALLRAERSEGELVRARAQARARSEWAKPMAPVPAPVMQAAEFKT